MLNNCQRANSTTSSQLTGISEGVIRLRQRRLTVGVVGQTSGSLCLASSLVRFRMASAMAALVTLAHTSDNFPCNVTWRCENNKWTKQPHLLTLLDNHLKMTSFSVVWWIYCTERLPQNYICEHTHTNTNLSNDYTSGSP